MLTQGSRAPAASLVRAFVGLAPFLAIVALVLVQGAVLASAGSTLGYDFEAYRRAGERVLAGQPLYDPAAATAGPFALFLYPPPFAIAMVPFAALPADLARGAWLGAMLASFLVGTALLPVRPGIRWTVVALAAICLPFLYAVKLGQVGPLLYLCFALAWWAMDAPIPTGIALAAGLLSKLQPGLLFGWLAFRGRFLAIVIGLAVCAGAVVVSTLVVGIGAWHDYVDLLRRVSDPISTPKNMTFGAIAFRAGVDSSMAALIQNVTVVAVLGVTVFAWLRRDPAASLMVGVMASQLVSPVLWDHYAMLVLLPVALLLQRRRWWAVALPILPWLGIDILYPLSLSVALGALVLGGPGDDDVPVIHAWPGTPGW